MAEKVSRPAASDLLCPKAVHKRVHPSGPNSSDFPIDHLPAEINHMICSYLKPLELANLRLVSRVVGPISLQYMVPEVHLILAKDSFEQLKALAAHPIVSKVVTSFFFEADKFAQLVQLSREQWERTIVSPEFFAQAKTELSDHASARSVRTCNRDVSKRESSPCHHYTEEQLEHAFGKYVGFVRFQHNSATHEKEMAEAMKHFPRLNEFTLASSPLSHNRTSRLKRFFEPAFLNQFETGELGGSQSEPRGLRQMRSLLLAAYHAGDNETFARMRDSASNVKKLRLEFGTDKPGSIGEARACSSYLAEGRLGEFVVAAPKLEHLQTSFHLSKSVFLFQANLPADLSHIFGKHHWPSLKSIDLKMITATEDDLVSFCSRHASTLKSIHLTSIPLKQGNWFHAFSRMRKLLALDTFVLAGRLNPVLNFNEDYYKPKLDLKHHIERWFLRSGPGTEMELVDFLKTYLTDDRGLLCWKLSSHSGEKETMLLTAPRGKLDLD